MLQDAVFPEGTRLTLFSSLIRPHRWQWGCRNTTATGNFAPQTVQLNWCMSQLFTQSGGHCNKPVDCTCGESVDTDRNNVSVTDIKKTTNTSKQTIIFGVWQSRGCHTIVWMTPLGDSIKRYIRQSEPHTCAAGLVLGAVPMQQQCEDQDQNKDESHQSHDQQKPPLLIERTLRQRCTQGEEQTGGRGGTHTSWGRYHLFCFFSSHWNYGSSHMTRKHPQISLFVERGSWINIWIWCLLHNKHSCSYVTLPLDGSRRKRT